MYWNYVMVMAGIFNVQICMLEVIIQIQNTIYFGLGSLKDTLCRFATVNCDLTTQLSIIITSLLTPNFACNVKEYFKNGGPKSTYQSQNALCGTPSDI